MPLFDFSARHDTWFDALPRSPQDVGRVVALVVRPRSGQPGTRTTPDSIQVSPLGVEGDRWFEKPDRRDDMQVSLINTHVLRALVDSPEDAPITGDNIELDLDLSEANLPVGTRLAIGAEAVLELGRLPHTGCAKFADRVGRTNAKRIARANRRGLRGRGALCRVVRAGAIRVGDEVRVERPGG